MLNIIKKYYKRNKIRSICERYRIIDYSINDDYSIDVYEDVYLYLSVSKLPLVFNRVSGHFSIADIGLKTLRGCPKYVEKDFNCSDNKLTSLEGSPEYVGGNFFCLNNLLTSMEGCPPTLTNFINCELNNLKTTKYIPYTCWVHFRNNPHLPREIFMFGNFSLVLKYQEEYGIWNSDDSLNKGRWDIFLNDYKSGALDEKI